MVKQEPVVERLASSTFDQSGQEPTNNLASEQEEPTFRYGTGTEGERKGVALSVAVSCPVVAVIGDWILDEAVDGSVKKFAQEADGVPVFVESGRSFSFGGAANVSVNCGSLSNGEVYTVSVGCAGVGPSDLTMLQMLSQSDLIRNWSAVPVDVGAVARKIRYYSGGRLLFRVDFDPDSELVQNEVSKVWDSSWSNLHLLSSLAFRASVFVLVSYNKGFLGSRIVEDLLYKVHHFGVPVVFYDPGNPKPFDRLLRMDLDRVVLKMNWSQWCSALESIGRPPGRSEMYVNDMTYVKGTKSTQTSTDIELAQCLARCSLESVADELDKAGASVWLSLGCSGSVLRLSGSLRNGSSWVYVTPKRVDTVGDPCGAGDVLLAGAAVMVAKKASRGSVLSLESWQDALEFATSAASVSLTKRGSCFVSYKEVVC